MAFFLNPVWLFIGTRGEQKRLKTAVAMSICVQAWVIMWVNHSASPQNDWLSLGQSLSFAEKKPPQLYPPPPCQLPNMCEDSWGGGRGGGWGGRQHRAFHNCIGAHRNKEDGAQHPLLWCGTLVSFVHPRPKHQLVSCTLYIHPPITRRPLLLFPPVPSTAASRQPTASSSTLPWSATSKIPNDTQTTFILIQASKSPYRANPERVKYSE